MNDKKRKQLLAAAVALVGLIIFVLTVFVFQAPDGYWGLAICILSLFMIFAGIVKLCVLSPRFEDSFLKFLDVLSWLP